jgi:myo-inositol 2-dehydrogenase/D-chiro-inositol 1-dehydrogenase
MEKVKIAFVGCGGRMGAHLGHLIHFEDVEPVGFFDIRKERAEEKRNFAGKGRVYDSFTDMLDGAKPDALYICVPPDQHGEIEFEAIKRKIDLFVEKPMALSMDLAYEIRDKAAEAGIIADVGFQDRYLDIIERTRSFLKSRTVAMADGAWVGGIPGVYWWPKYETSGGQIVEQNIHIYDLTRYLFGEPERVYCSAGKGIVKREDYDLHDYSSAVITMKNGIIVTLFTGCYTGNHPGFKNGMNIHCVDAEIEYRLRDHVIFATKTEILRYNRIEDNTMVESRFFIDAVKSRDASKLRSPYADACKTLALTLACNESIKTGREITL